MIGPLFLHDLGQLPRLFLHDLGQKSQLFIPRLFSLAGNVHAQYAWRRPRQQTGYIVNNGGAIAPKVSFISPRLAPKVSAV